MKRILFVDDDQSILDGLRCSLRRQRKNWEMVFAPGGESGLEALESDAFDVLVTDMRMPKVDGVELLKRAQQLQPEMVRIVLSGFAEEKAILRTITVAHQFLNKPCDVSTLENVIERACNIQSILSNPEIRTRVGSIDALPALPQNYNALNKVLANDYATMAHIARIIEQDIGMSAKILQIVNSAFFGLARPLASIQDAIRYLGINVVQTLVLSIEVFQTFEDVDPAEVIDVSSLHDHSLLTARIAKQLCANPDEGKDAFAAAILHDVGQLILATWLPELITQSVVVARQRGEPLEDVETELHGFSHGEVGAYLLGRWGLPYPIIEAVAYHDRPRRVKQSQFDILSAVYVADHLAYEYSGIAEDQCTPHGVIDEAYLEELGLLDQLPKWRQIAEKAASEPSIGV